MNLRMFANFLRVAEIGSIKATAEAVNLAQPALTRQIALLEEEFAAQLLVRHSRGVKLTEAGEQLRIYFERILSEVAAARVALSVTAQQPSGRVALGLPTSMLYVLSSTVISAYQQAYPNVMLKVHEAVGNVVADLLHARRLDVAILFWEAHSPEVDITPLVTEDLYLAGPPDAGLDLAQPVPVSYLAEIPIVLLPPQNPVRLMLERELARCNLGFRSSLEIEGQPLALDLVRNGTGYTVLPLGAVQAEMAAGRISGAPISGLSVTWAIGVNRLRAYAPAVRELVRMIETITDNRIASGQWNCVRH
jgi:DNA-binding transcriptional LysR family regulator